MYTHTHTHTGIYTYNTHMLSAIVDQLLEHRASFASTIVMHFGVFGNTNKHMYHKCVYINA